VLAPVQLRRFECKLEKFLDAMTLAGSNDKSSAGLLQHQPHRFDVVAGETPIAFGAKIAESELVLDPV